MHEFRDFEEVQLHVLVQTVARLGIVDAVHRMRLGLRQDVERQDIDGDGRPQFGVILAAKDAVENEQ